MIDMKISRVVFEMPEERTRLANMPSEGDAKRMASFEKSSKTLHRAFLEDSDTVSAMNAIGDAGSCSVESSVVQIKGAWEGV